MKNPVKGIKRKRVRIARVLMTVVVLVIAAVRAHAQGQPGPIPPPAKRQLPQPPPDRVDKNAPSPAISIETALVSLDVLVTDEDGLVLAGLKKENFRILDEGKPQTIIHFEPTGAPITIVMLMVYSGSAYDYLAYKAASWGSTFLNHLEPKDYLALVTYDIKPTVRVDFTRNRGCNRTDVRIRANEEGTCPDCGQGGKRRDREAQPPDYEGIRVRTAQQN